MGVSTNDLIEMMRRHVHDADESANAANDLWTWLPSHKAATVSHGDYALEHRPSDADVMREAASLIASMLDGEPSDELVRWAGCPCGECALTEPEDARALVVNVMEGRA